MLQSRGLELPIGCSVCSTHANIDVEGGTLRNAIDCRMTCVSAQERCWTRIPVACGDLVEKYSRMQHVNAFRNICTTIQHTESDDDVLEVILRTNPTATPVVPTDTPRDSSHPKRRPKKLRSALLQFCNGPPQGRSPPRAKGESANATEPRARRLPFAINQRVGTRLSPHPFPQPQPHPLCYRQHRLSLTHHGRQPRGCLPRGDARVQQVHQDPLQARAVRHTVHLIGRRRE